MGVVAISAFLPRLGVKPSSAIGMITDSGQVLRIGVAYLSSTVAVAIATVAGRLFLAVTSLPNISMVFLMAVLFSAVSFGIWPAIYASVLSFLAYNFFFIEPLYTFQIAEAHPSCCLWSLPDCRDRYINTRRARSRSSARRKRRARCHAPPV